MKIVQCFFNFEVGGAEVLAVDLMNEMCVDHDVSLIIINDKYSDHLINEINKRVQIFYFQRKVGSLNPLPIIRLNLLLLRLRPDVIHCHDANAVRIIKIKSARLLKTIHDIGMPTDYYHLYDVVIAISDAVYKDVSVRFTGAPVKTIYNGIHFDLFKRRSQYLIDNNQSLKLVQVSRLVHYKKGHDVLLKALHRLVFDYEINNITLDFIGIGASKNHLQEMVTKLGLQSHVNFLGERNREWLYQNLSSYHLLVQPSRYEGFGLTVLEAFAAGLPVLTSDIDGPAEIIANFPRSFSFKSGDSDDCAHMLAHLYYLFFNGNMDASITGNYDQVCNKYSIQTCAERYLQEYRP